MAMLPFACGRCGRKLQVPDELAGKAVKCGGCGHVTHAPRPATVSSGGPGQPPTLPSVTPGPAAAAPAPVPSVVAEQPTGPPPSRSDATNPSVAPSEGDTGLTDFLAPPLAADELGRLGGFRILKVLGRGGMGAVFLGEDPRLGRQVAIKVMLPHLAASNSAQQRFLREARAAADFQHDHIVPILQIGEDRGAPFIVMPLLRGASLDRHLQDGRPLPVAELLRIGREAAEGLAAAHERGLIHRDIKPANIWLEAPRGRVKILDFGLARLTQSAGGQNLTQSGVIMGTPSYMAPEQARGETIDARADLFSLGVVLYRLCTGAMPFTGKDPISTLMAVLTDDPPAPHTINPSLPQPLSDLVMKLLAKDPAKRFGSADEVVAALQAVARPAPASAPSAAAAPVAPPAAAADNPWADLAEPAVTAPHRPKPAKAGAIPVPPRRLALVLAAAALLGLALGGVVLFEPTATGTVQIEVNDPAVKVAFDNDGPTITGADKESITLKAGEHGIQVTRGDFAFETDRFVLKKGETVALRVEFLAGKVRVVKNGELFAQKGPPPGPQGPPPARPANPDREAAAWVLSVGGKVVIRVADQEKEVAAAGGLPAGAFKLTRVNLWDNQKVTDGELVHLAGLDSLEQLSLAQTRVGDAGLAHLEGLSCLNYLCLRATRVTDAGLESLKGLTNLETLDLSFTHVTGPGLAHLKGLSKLTSLYLWGSAQFAGLGLEHLAGVRLLDLSFTPISDTGLQHLEGLRNLWSLNLNGTPVSDPGLARLKDLSKLTTLGLDDTAVSDAGLEHLRGLTALERLELHGTRVTDAGLKDLEKLAHLKEVNVTGTKATAAGVAALRKALPECEIVWAASPPK
jgi:hypothetical protein